MLSLRRKAVQSAPRIRLRYASTHHGEGGNHGHESGHGHGHHHHEAPKPESLGTQFYIFLAAIPTCIGVYTLSQPTASGKPALTNFINSYSEWQAQFAARNSLHTAMIEQAAFDRNLFQSSPGTKHVDLRFPETFNTGSPYNIVAGQSSRGIDELVKHYEKINEEQEKKITARLEEEKAS